MANLYRTKGFIFKKRNKGESDQIFSIYTQEFGRVEVVAKGIRKIKSKLRSGADIFYLSEFEFAQGRNQKTLTDAVLKNSFGGIRKDLRKFTLAKRVVSVLDFLIHGQERDSKVWAGLIETFDKLQNCESKSQAVPMVYYIFLWNLFDVLGYAPNLDNCSFCHKKFEQEKIFLEQEDLLFCDRKCQKGGRYTEIQPEVISLLRQMVLGQWELLLSPDLSKEQANILRDLSHSFLIKHTAGKSVASFNGNH